LRQLLSVWEKFRKNPSFLPESNRKNKRGISLALIEGAMAVFHLVPLSFLDPSSAIDLKNSKEHYGKS
jgi:hypothetical protein